MIFIKKMLVAVRVTIFSSLHQQLRHALDEQNGVPVDMANPCPYYLRKRQCFDHPKECFGH